MLTFVGGATKGDYVGNCNIFNQFRGEMLGIVSFSNVPEQWRAMVDEYHNFRTQAIVVAEPIYRGCQNGGGTIDEETDRKITGLLDCTQNRMYEMLQ